jgi:hypothetical protein
MTINNLTTLTGIDLIDHMDCVGEVLQGIPGIHTVYLGYVKAYNNQTGNNVTEEQALNYTMGDEESVGRCLWDSFIHWYLRTYLKQFHCKTDPVVNIPDVIINYDDADYETGPTY